MFWVWFLHWRYVVLLLPDYFKFLLFYVLICWNFMFCPLSTCWCTRKQNGTLPCWNILKFESRKIFMCNGKLMFCHSFPSNRNWLKKIYGKIGFIHWPLASKYRKLELLYILEPISAWTLLDGTLYVFIEDNFNRNYKRQHLSYLVLSYGRYENYVWNVGSRSQRWSTWRM